MSFYGLRKHFILFLNCKYPSIPLGHLVHLKGNNENVRTVLIVLKYDQFSRKIIREFKMAVFLMSLQGGFTKLSCYLCHWDNRDTHYHKQIWPKTTSNGAFRIDPSEILIPTIAHKLGLIKQVIKALDRNSEAIQYLESFSRFLKQR